MLHKAPPDFIEASIVHFLFINPYIVASILRFYIVSRDGCFKSDRLALHGCPDRLPSWLLGKRIAIFQCELAVIEAVGKFMDMMLSCGRVMVADKSQSIAATLA
jgi:hypothetical protein